MTTHRYFIIRFADYIEVRVAKNRPTSVVSTITRQEFPSKPKKQIILKQVFYMGGKLLGTVKYAQYHSMFPSNPIKVNEMIEVTRQTRLTILKGRSW